MRNSKSNSSSVFNKHKTKNSWLYWQQYIVNAPLKLSNIWCAHSTGEKKHQLLNSLKKQLSHFAVKNALCLILCENKLLANRSFLFSASWYRNTTFSLIFYIFPHCFSMQLAHNAPVPFSTINGCSLPTDSLDFVPRKQPMTSFPNTKTRCLCYLSRPSIWGAFFNVQSQG